MAGRLISSYPNIITNVIFVFNLHNIYFIKVRQRYNRQLTRYFLHMADRLLYNFPIFGKHITDRRNPAIGASGILIVDKALTCVVNKPFSFQNKVFC